MNTSKAVVSVCVLVGLLATTASAVNIETMPVGNPGNVADSRSGDGSVGYTYNIGTYEVTAVQFTEFLNNKARVDTYGLYNSAMWTDTTYGCRIQQSGTPGNYTYSVASDYANRPVNYVSFWDACRFANWLHNGQGNGDTETGTYTLNGYNGSDGRTIQRSAGATWAVTSDDEWYKAAYYKGGSTNAGYFNYPTSSDTAPGQDMDDASENNANWYTAPYAFPIDSGKYTTVGGEFQNSASPYGTFDQAGNVWEWIENVCDPSERGLRGSSFDDGNYDDMHAVWGHGHSRLPSAEWYAFGFRVSEVPEPCSALMVLVGAFGLASIRRWG